MNTIKLDEICNLIDSLHSTPQYVKKGFPMVRATDISNKFLDLTNCLQVSKVTLEKHNKKYTPQKGDILITRVGVNLGKVSYIDTNELFCLGQNISIISSKNNGKFLYYYLLSSKMQFLIKNSVSGSAYKCIGFEKLKKLPCDFNINYINQNKIGNLLYNIDKKIELNNKINAELEAIAKTIYDYWFLQFEFPNKEGKPYKSSGGKMVWNEELKREIPEGWKVKKISDILDNVPNTIKKSTKEYLTNGVYPIIDQSSNYICGYTNDKNAVLSLKDAIVFGDHTKCIKYVNFNFARGADGTQIILSKEKKLSNLLLYYQIKDINLLSQGYSRYFKFLKEQKIIIPKEYTTNKFDNIIGISYKKIRENLFESQELISLRDFLLPLLMNGQVGFKN